MRNGEVVRLEKLAFVVAKSQEYHTASCGSKRPGNELVLVLLMLLAIAVPARTRLGTKLAVSTVASTALAVVALRPSVPVPPLHLPPPLLLSLLDLMQVFENTMLVLGTLPVRLELEDIPRRSLRPLHGAYSIQRRTSATVE